MPPGQMMVMAIHRVKLGAALQQRGYITLDVPFFMATFSAGLNITTESVMAESAKRATFGLAFFACYQNIQMFHFIFELVRN